MNDVENIESPFLKDAITAKKWAFATDFLRFYIVYHFGGIYMDSDIYVYRNFKGLLDCDGFTSLEGSAILRTETKKKDVAFGLEAAVFGAVKHSPWIKNVLDFYSDKRFINTPEFCLSIIAPKTFWRQSLPFGLREVFSFQKLEGNVAIYPLDTLSCIADYNLYGLSAVDFKKVGIENPLRYACHLCNNGWGWQPPKTIIGRIKNIVISIIGAKLAVDIKNMVKMLWHK